MYSGRLKVTWRELPFLLLFGITGVAFVQWFYFLSIHRLPVGIALLIEYLAPLLVALWARYVLHEDVRRRIWAALVLALVGPSRPSSSFWGAGESALDSLGVAAALAACIAYAVYILMAERGVTPPRPDLAHGSTASPSRRSSGSSSSRSGSFPFARHGRQRLPAREPRPQDVPRSGSSSPSSSLIGTTAHSRSSSPRSATCRPPGRDRCDARARRVGRGGLVRLGEMLERPADRRGDRSRGHRIGPDGAAKERPELTPTASTSGFPAVHDSDVQNRPNLRRRRRAVSCSSAAAPGARRRCARANLLPPADVPRADLSTASRRSASTPTLQRAARAHTRWDVRRQPLLPGGFRRPDAPVRSPWAGDNREPRLGERRRSAPRCARPEVAEEAAPPEEPPPRGFRRVGVGALLGTFAGGACRRRHRRLRRAVNQSPLHHSAVARRASRAELLALAALDAVEQRRGRAARARQG